jgi:uncharacterized membrane protein
MRKLIPRFFSKNWPEIFLGILIVAYIGYFSLFSIIRYQTLYAHYFDLGIMNQTVYNTFMSIKSGDYSRFLELTNPHGFDQIKRMAIHNDMFLAFLAPLYFIYSGSETLLVFQTVAIALGAIAVYGISKIIFNKTHNARHISLFFSFAYLMYPPLQRMNQFDFHAVALATPLLLFMFYCYLNKRYVISFLCAGMVLLTKEQVGLTLAFFGFFVLFQNWLQIRRKEHNKSEFLLGGILVMMGVGWFLFSMMYIIPHFRHDVHFALGYFGDFGDSPLNVFVGLIKNPLLVFQYVFRKDTYDYVYSVLGPVGFLSILSPLHLFIVTPEFAINLLSKSGAMRNIYYHYTAVITPFVIISAMYGFRFFMGLIRRAYTYTWLFISLYLVCILYFSAVQSPLPFSLGKEIHPFMWPAKERFDAFDWQFTFADENIKVMATGSLAPLFSSRRYLYNFSERYDLADYIVLSRDEVYNGYESFKMIAPYEKLINDVGYSNIYKNGSFEVYKKL